jgi:hypothetical protein
MLTPLFPTDHELITLKQGKAGDCYLLAALDCIFNTPQGRAKVKSLFRESATGYTLRIKRSPSNSFLQFKKLEGKYQYFFDESTQEDVFFISKRRAQLIGVNSI